MPDKIITDGNHRTRNRKSNYVKCDLRLDFVLQRWQKIALALDAIVSKRAHILKEFIDHDFVKILNIYFKDV